MRVVTVQDARIRIHESDGRNEELKRRLGALTSAETELLLAAYRGLADDEAKRATAECIDAAQYITEKREEEIAAFWYQAGYADALAEANTGMTSPAPSKVRPLKQ